MHILSFLFEGLKKGYCDFIFRYLLNATKKRFFKDKRKYIGIKTLQFSYFFSATSLN